MAATLGLYGTVDGQGLCPDQVAQRRGPGLCACRHYARAQTLLVPSGDCAPVVGCPAVAGTLLGFQRPASQSPAAARPYRRTLGDRDSPNANDKSEGAHFEER